MKVFFYFDFEGMTDLFHALALDMKKRHKITGFAGMVNGRREHGFLKNQKDMKYEHLGLVQEIWNSYKNEKPDYDYLESLEKEYGIPTLWPFIYAERNIVFDPSVSVYYNRFAKYRKEDSLRILQAFFKYTIKTLKRVKPDFVVFTCVASLPSYVLYRVAQKMGIPTLIPTSVRMGNMHTISRNTYEGLDRALATYKKMVKTGKPAGTEDKARAFLREFRKTRIKPSYLKTIEEKVGSGGAVMTPGRIKNILKYFYNYNFGYYKDDYIFTGKTTIKAVVDEIEKRRRKKKIRGMKIFSKPDYTEKYAFFPLHFEPEMAIMVQAPFFVDQINVIENIAKSLPIDFKLYVKDHPRMGARGLRPISYYKKLLSIPNVRLIDPEMSSYELIKHSRIVLAITGTVGWEGILLKKPVITFGRVFYNELDMTRKCNDFTKLPDMIHDMLENYKHDEKELVRFISALFEESFEFNFFELLYKRVSNILSHPDLKVLSDQLIREMRRK